MGSPISALISMNAFKGSLSNEEACEIVSRALKKRDIECRLLPVGDGGAGTLWAVHSTLGGKIVPLETSGPLSKKVQARLLCFPDQHAPDTLYVESAESCGYHLLQAGERDAMRASSLGLGQLLKQAFELWGKSLKRVYVGLGDSASSDMGMGMLSGLGFVFLDDGNRSLWPNADSLRHMRTIKVPELPFLHSVRFTVLCDVMNPLCGLNGSARVYGPQKGATPGQVSLIEQGMENFAAIVVKMTGRNLRTVPMSGAAGGLGAAFLAFFNAELVQGASFLMDWINFDRVLSQHTFLITGEGRTDLQTLSGKAPLECLERAARQGKKAIVISGMLGEGHESLLRRPAVAGCFACGAEPTAKDALFDRTLEIFSDDALVESLAVS